MTMKGVRESLGFLGVIASLIFVGMEIRQNTRMARAEAYRAIEVQRSEWNFVSASDAELALLMRRLTLEGTRRDELTDTEKWQAGAMYDTVLRGLESVYRQVQEGLLPTSFLDTFDQHNLELTAPYMRDLWPVVRVNYSADFVEYVEGQFGLHP